MKKSDFYFDLPPELIAQTPPAERDGGRLLRLDRRTGAAEHGLFREIPELLRAGDCLVLNDSRVIPARLLGRRETGGAVEIVLLRDLGNGLWECVTRPGKKTRPGTRLFFGADELRAEVESASDSGLRNIRFFHDGIFSELLDKLGKMPLPPYIRGELTDRERYQTVYSRVSGSAAAPTAGLHFTRDLLDEIRARGVEVVCVTLHVGLGTFRPVKSDDIEDHVMHAEYCAISGRASEAVNAARESGGRVVAVGTTSCRALESRAGRGGLLEPFSGFTNIFIYPGYEFKCIDGLLTNLHLPESTLIMLVSAFAGRENVMRAYDAAIRARYRFFSFGDAMLII
ncbi:MAG: tRNA preQ1(34) S-adenosylmethionine ribosyltransferase-isomerase QueA [Oscillospiraceae bacterium]|jgi:S-adenosylmethionine:tRNA ribosyltransferase-isomerase|nr:tRNA preQ1(34) S-adenosylmethionine ribosyltransferase-isomerase QueA [Oscillospiraceae bacterium]